jgi:hypothetical protein
MADRKISDLTALTTPASGDFLPIVDISEAAAASKNKSITIEELMRGVPDGTAAAPGIAFETDPNTGIYSPGADQLAVATNGTGRLFVDASGNVGVGTASPGTNFHLNNNPSWAAPTGGIPTNTQAWISSGIYTGLGIQGGSAGATYFLFADENDGDAGYISYAHSADSMIFGVNAAERARIDSSGRLLVGTGSDSGGALFQVNGDRIRVGTAKTPATSGATGTTGEIAWDADYIYVCTATNTWKRSAIATW